MIIWDNFKLQNASYTVTVTAAQITATHSEFGTYSGMSIRNNGLAAGLDAYAIVANRMSANTVYANVVEAAEATIASATIEAGTFYGTIQSGSVFSGEVSSLSVAALTATNFVGNTATISSLTVTDHIKFEGQPKIDLAEGSTYNGQKLLTWPKQYGFYIDAYQGPGANWIEIRNYTNNTLNISSLQFSNHTWEAEPSTQGISQIDPITAHDVWRAENWWEWGADDTPHNIVITYTTSNNSTPTTITWTPEEWQAPGAILFGEDTTLPGQILMQNDQRLIVLYSSNTGTDVQAWYAYAITSGFNDTNKFTYFGANNSGTVVGNNLTDSSSLVGTYILTFPKA